MGLERSTGVSHFSCFTFFNIYKLLLRTLLVIKITYMKAYAFSNYDHIPIPQHVRAFRRFLSKMRQFSLGFGIPETVERSLKGFTHRATKALRWLYMSRF